MLKGPLTLASIGLAVNMFLWGAPGMVAASGAVHALLPEVTSTQQQTLATLDSKADKSIYTALLGLIGAESEALQVAGAGLQQPTPSDLAPRANAAGADVQVAVAAYIKATLAVVNH